MDVRSVFHGVILYHAMKHRTHICNRALFATQHNTTRHVATVPNWNSEINMTFNSNFSKDNIAP